MKRIKHKETFPADTAADGSPVYDRKAFAKPAEPATHPAPELDLSREYLDSISNNLAKAREERDMAKAWADKWEGLSEAQEKTIECLTARLSSLEEMVGDDLAPAIWKADDEWNALIAKDQLAPDADWAEWIGNAILEQLRQRRTP